MEAMIGCFGEVMLRFSPEPDNMMTIQSDLFRALPGGSESNVAIALSRLGHDTEMLTALPQNTFGTKIIQCLKQHGVGTGKICFLDGGRLGLYFTEKGSGRRPHRVLYDRKDSAFNFLTELVSNLDTWLTGCEWLHLSGISLATSRRAADFAIELVNHAQDRGIPISLDINHRTRLWQWCRDSQERGKYLSRIIAGTTVLVGNETDIQVGVLDDPAVHLDEAVDTVQELSKGGPLTWICVSQRESESADVNRFGGLLFDVGNRERSPIPIRSEVHTISHVVDRIGTGDAFCAAVLDEFIRKQDPGLTIEKAAMLGTLMHGVRGDACVLDHELLEICLADGSGTIRR